MLYRELVRRGVSDYVLAPVGPIDVVRSICNLFSAPEAKAVGRIIAVVGAKGGRLPRLQLREPCTAQAGGSAIKPGRVSARIQSVSQT